MINYLDREYNSVHIFLERKRVKTSDGESDSDAEVDDEYKEYVHF